jgi:hypothetical protein
LVALGQQVQYCVETLLISPTGALQNAFLQRNYAGPDIHESIWAAVNYTTGVDMMGRRARKYLVTPFVLWITDVSRHFFVTFSDEVLDFTSDN